MTELLLALNVGSSSLKFQVVARGSLKEPLLAGAVERVGTDKGTITIRQGDGAKVELPNEAPDHAAAIATVASLLSEHYPGVPVRGVGHRIVHGGGKFTDPVILSSENLSELDQIVTLAPLHLPNGLAGIRAAQSLFPGAQQIGCFDTGFHSTKPWIHDAFALPRHFYDEGVRRYGFHGISVQSVLRSLQEEGYPVSDRKLAVAHLGNGCSVTAVDKGMSVASSMGFSTLDGLAMGTRCGRIDPGVLIHLLRSGQTWQDLEALLYRQSGLLGISGFSNDMRDLGGSELPEAREAIDYFVARIIEETSRMAGVLNGLDTLVFCGGIGENAGSVRQSISDGLSFLPGPKGTGIEVLVRNSQEETEILMAVDDLLPETR